VPLLIVLLLLLAGNPLAAQTQYERRELQIPMRDGARLFAVALIPRESDTPLPILFMRTPFSAAGGFRGDQVPGPYRELAEDGYIFVIQDIRGRFKSEGEFVTLRAQQDPRSPRGVNESTDTWDSVDWLVKHLPANNGRVGVIGMSYPGWLAALAGVNAHPAIKAISPQAPMGDTWMGDDFFHQGAFRQTQGAVYSGVLEADPKGFSELVSTGDDQYSFYLQFPTLDSLARATGVSNLPLWRAAADHPAYDQYWQSRALPRVLRRATVPTLIVGGWWDAEDLLGPQLLYRTLEQHDGAGTNRLVLGPWTHGSWMRPGGDSIGAIPLGSPTADYYRREIQRPWFAYYLHARGAAPAHEAWVFETGANAWRTFDQWPPRQVQSRKLYLRADGKLGFEPPMKGQTPEFEAFLSDPADPVPFAPRPITDDGWATWLLNDQRFLRDRRDVLTWRSEPLVEDLVIAGDVIARLVASTAGTDADWVVKLIDQYPDAVPDSPPLGGFQLMVNSAILRGRYWRGFTRATPVPSQTPTGFTVDLHQQLYRFRKGHRLVVQVQSSWFPLYDRNPQTFVPNIFRAPGGAYRAMEHRVWQTAKYPSHLVLPVMPASPAERMGQ
jgi:putative CocE/NonD family hydrolase